MSEIEEWNRVIETWLNSSTLRTFTIIVRSAGSLTILGACYIIQDILKDVARRKTTKNRIILFMSGCDFLNVFVNSVLGPVMVPKGISVPGAVGNQLSCDVQGFLAYASGAASGMLNVSLALCYLLMVRYEYSDERLQKLEPYFLYVPLFTSLSMAIPGLPFGIYNFNGTFTCFINASPFNCDEPMSPVECERGEQYTYWFYWNCFLILIETCVIIFFMIKMYTAVLQRERSGDQFRFRIASRPDSRGRTLSNTMRSQGLWYSGAFLFTFFPVMLFSLWKNYYSHMIYSLTFQLIGFTNAVIYVRPRFIKFRRDFPSVGVTLSIWFTLVRKRPATSGGDMSTSNSATTEWSSSLRAALDSLSSGIQSLVAVMTSSIVVSSGEGNHPSDSLASTEKDEVTPSRQEGGNNGDDGNCSVIIENGVQTHQGTCMGGNNNDSEMVGSEDQQK
jgi:hypothetical protein